MYVLGVAQPVTSKGSCFYFIPNSPCQFSESITSRMQDITHYNINPAVGLVATNISHAFIVVINTQPRIIHSAMSIHIPKSWREEQITRL